MVRRENRRRLVVGLVKHPQKRNTPRWCSRGVFLVFGERFANRVRDPEAGAKLEGYFCDGLPDLSDAVVIEEIPGFLGDGGYGFVFVEVPAEDDEAGESAVVCEVDVFEVGHSLSVPFRVGGRFGQLVFACAVSRAEREVQRPVALAVDGCWPAAFVALHVVRSVPFLAGS